MPELPARLPTSTVGRPNPIARVYPVELYDEADPIVHVPDPYNVSAFVAVRRSSVTSAVQHQPRDLSPQPLFDPLAQRMLGAGVGGGALSAGAGWGIAQVVSAAAGGVTGIVALALLLLAARVTAPRPSVRIDQHVTNNNRWFGKSTTRM